MTICEHPKDNYEKIHSQFNMCPECRSHVCLRCGLKEQGAWMSGVCDGCYRIRERENREQQAKWSAEARRQDRERIWSEGWNRYRTNFSPSDPDFGVNPYTTKELS